MYQVFNMGHRLEFFADPKAADDLIRAGEAFHIETKIVGRVEAADKKSLLLVAGAEEIVY